MREIRGGEMPKVRVEFLGDTKNVNHYHIVTNPESVKKLEVLILSMVPGSLMKGMVAGRLKTLHDNNDYRLPKRVVLDWGQYKIEIEVITNNAKGGGKV